MEENWKFIEGTNDMYKISDLGNVFSVFTGTIRKPQMHKNYLVVQIRVNGITHKLSIHRLVAKAFIPNPLNKPEINHLNAIKTDNRATNLEWCTNEENRIHAINLGLIPKGIQCAQAIFTENDIKNIRTLAFFGVSNKEISISYSTNQSNIHSIVNNKTWRHVFP